MSGDGEAKRNRKRATLFLALVIKVSLEITSFIDAATPTVNVFRALFIRWFEVTKPVGARTPTLNKLLLEKPRMSPS